MQKNPILGQVIGIPFTSFQFNEDHASVPEPVSPFLQPSSHGSKFKKNKTNSVIQWMSKLSMKADNYVLGIREHVSLGAKISGTVKGKLSLSARIIQAGGVERVFRQVFYVEKGEKLLNAFQCYLSTTAGPIAGMLFVSTEKIAFHSDRSLRLTSPKGELARVPYKVLIPLRRIKRTISSKSADKPNQKFIQIVTADEFEFWFMGFLCYRKCFRYLLQAISQPAMSFLQ